MPFVESIKSYLPVADEIVVVDGGSTDGTIEELRKLDVKIITQKWEKNWTYWRMNRNFNRGYEECKGDIVFRFDTDRVLHEDDIELLKSEFNRMKQEKYVVLKVSRLNIPEFNKCKKMDSHIFAVNKIVDYEIKIGIDFSELPFHNTFIRYEKNEFGLNQGTIIDTLEKTLESNIREFNYGYRFSKQPIENIMIHYNALEKQKKLMGLPYKLKNRAEIIHYEKTKPRYTGYDTIDIEDHPKIIRERIKQWSK